MADARTAIMTALQNEDRGLTGKISLDNNGAKVRYGINAASNPDLWNPGPPTLDQAIARYASQYWPEAFASLNSQHEANFILDLAINMGPKQAARILQKAINACGATVVIDGVIGANTVVAANSCNEAQLIAAIVNQADAFYEQLVSIKPEEGAYLKGWLARVRGDAGVPLDPGLTAD